MTLLWTLTVYAGATLLALWALWEFRQDIKRMRRARKDYEAAP